MSHKFAFDKTGALKSIPQFKMILNPKSYRMAHPVYHKTDIETIKKREFAFDDEEHSDGLRCVAAPIFGASGEVMGALSISVPSVRVNENQMVANGQAVHRVAKEMTRALGGTWPS